MSKTIVKLADAPKRLRLKKMQIAGFMAHASAKNRILVGFYRDESGKIRPVTKSVGEVRRKKVVKRGKQFRGVKPQRMHVDEESQEYIQSLPLKRTILAEVKRTIKAKHLNEIASAMTQWEGYKRIVSVSKLFNDVLKSSEFAFADGTVKKGINWNSLTTDERKYIVRYLKDHVAVLKVHLFGINPRSSGFGAGKARSYREFSARIIDLVDSDPLSKRSWNVPYMQQKYEETYRHRPSAIEVKRALEEYQRDINKPLPPITYRTLSKSFIWKPKG